MRCPACDETNRDRARFCDACGAPLPVTPPEPPARMEDGVPAGERKQVTVFFADVQGSMDLSEDVDAEEWRRILDRFVDILVDGVRRFDGTVTQFTGDGIMALFGAPVAQEDHAHRACYAALHVGEHLRRYSRELRRERGLGFTVRMGMHSGEVVVGTIGAGGGIEYTAVGHAVGLARRVETLAEPGSVYLTEDTAAFVRGFFKLEDLGAFEVKGSREPVHVFELHGVGEHRTRLEVALARGFSRFVGRRREVGVLETALTAAEAGDGSVVSVVGDAGVGKSRLCHEFVTRARNAGITVFEAHVPPHGNRVPFGPVLELLRGYFGVGRGDEPAAARQRIAGSLLLLDETFRDDLQLVFDFLGVPDPDLPFPQPEPDARRARLFGVLERLIEARSSRGPAVIWVEDLQWVDEGSEAFIEHLVKTVPATRTVLLVNFRPVYRAPWASGVSSITLGPLGTDEVAELLDDLVGTDPSLDDLRRRITDRTSGNPFFVEEVVRELAATRALAGDRGSYRLVRPGADVAIPATVQAVLADRIDALDERERRVLQLAAVIGDAFTERMLRLVSGLPRGELEASLRSLRDAEFVFERTPYPEPEYAFAHPLTHDVAYRSQLAARRGPVHARVADAVEQLHTDGLDERAALIAHHREQAGDYLAAATWERRAAEWAGHNDAAESLRHWWRVREHLHRVAPSTDADALALASCIGIMNQGSRVGLSPEEAEALYEEGRALAETREDTRSLARLLLVYGRLRTQVGDLEAAAELALEAAGLAERSGWVGLRLAAAVSVVARYWQMGETVEALRITDESLREAPGNLRIGAEHLGYSPYIWLVMNRGRMLPWLGRCTEASEANERAIVLATEHDEREILCWAHQGQVDVGWLTGDAALAAAHAGPCLEIAERIGTSALLWSALYCSGRAHAMAGRWTDALRALSESLAMIRDTRTGVHGEILVLTALAQTQLGAGDVVAALEWAEEAVGFSRRLRQLPGGVLARVVLAQARRVAGEPAGDLLDEALEMLARESSPILEPFVRAERAEHLHDVQARAAELALAIEGYERMGAARRATELRRVGAR